MTDLMLVTGPSSARASWSEVPWPHPTDMAVIPCVGSDVCAALATPSVDGILPGLVKQATGKALSDYGRVGITSFSAGWGLVDKLGLSAPDRERLSAVVMLDSGYAGGDPNTGKVRTETSLPGLRELAARAVAEKLLMISTTSNTTGGAYLSASQSMASIWETARRAYYLAPQPVPPPGKLPSASGGWQRLGNLYWGNYVAPNSPMGQGSDLTHLEHHHLADKVWTALVVPYWTNDYSFRLFAAGAVAGAALAYYLARRDL